MPYAEQSANLDTPLPSGAWDTHFHIFPPNYPLGANGPFVPPRIPLSEAKRYHDALGIPNRVMAHSFAFGLDQSSLENWLDTAGGGTRRALAVLTPDTDEAEIKRLHAEGVRGIRATTSAKEPKEKAEQIKAIFERLDKAGVHWTVAVQEAPTPAVWDALLAIVDTLPRTQILMIDHFGFLPGPWGQSPPQTQSAEECHKLPYVEAVLALLSRENVYIKLSAPYRITESYEALEGLVEAIAKAAPSRIVWASDWPYVPVPEQIAAHKEKEGNTELTFRTEDIPRWIKLLRGWLGEELFDRMMVENPSRIYAQ